MSATASANETGPSGCARTPSRTRRCARLVHDVVIPHAGQRRPVSRRTTHRGGSDASRRGGATSAATRAAATTITASPAQSPTVRVLHVVERDEDDVDD